MAKGKYAHRADTRLRVLESEALREAHAEIKDLKKQVGAAKHESDTLRDQMHSQAMTAAAGLSAREKQNLRDQIASLEHKHAADRMRWAVLVWEIIHRQRFGRPAPPVLGGEDFYLNHADEVDVTAEQMQESYRLCLDLHWDLAALFFATYEEMEEFHAAIGEMRFRVAGEKGWATTREATRGFRIGKLRDMIMRREYRRREYFERIWVARQRGQVEPIEEFKGETEREQLIRKFKEASGG